MTAPSPRPPVRVVRITAGTAVTAVLVAVAALAARHVFVAARAPLSWAAAAAVVAVMIDPIVDRLDKRLPRLPSVIIALLVTTLAVWAAVYVALDDLSHGVDQLSQAAQEAADDLEDRDDRIGELARDVEASRRVDMFVRALDERVTGGDEVLASTPGIAPTYFVGGILTLFLMSYGPGLAQAALNQVPDPRRREEVAAVVTVALRRARTAVYLTLAEGVLAGIAVGAAAALLDLPSPAAMGLAAGVMALLPHVGLVLGTLPLVLLVAAQRTVWALVATVAVIVAAQLVDSFWLRRRIARRSVHVGLLVPWVVALVGYAVYGVGGTAYGLALAVFVVAVLDELSRRTRNPVPLERALGEGTIGTDGTDEPGAADRPGGPGDEPPPDAGHDPAAPPEVEGDAEVVPGLSRAD
ncbi:MAG TPA: AI-2E family transporter [Acidimicrobiales bacterium]|nr:AI-2E family transporter [Acidimicrobiales bacterium]